MRRLFSAAAIVALLVFRSSADEHIVLPEVDGPNPVGRAQWVVVDRGRIDPFTGASPRSVQIVAWYPATPGANGPTAPYLVNGADEARAFGAVFGDRTVFDALTQVATHASADAAPRAGSGALPTARARGLRRMEG